MDTNDEWISTRTGISARRVLTHETLTDIGEAACRRALENAGVEVGELDYILCATLRGDYVTPAQSCVLQERLGASCPAFDLNAACSGFVYALDVADGYFVRKKAKKILVVACDAMSQVVNWQDRSTCILFGDGAAAVVLGEGDDLLSIHLTAQGNCEALAMPHIRGNSPYLQGEQKPSVLHMQGQDVYKFAVSAFCDGINFLLEEAGVRPEEVSHLIPHQANLRIILAAQKKLAIPEDRFRINIQDYGNMSAASVPLLLDELNQAGQLQKGQIVAMCAFGGGLTTGSALIRWSK